MSHLKRRMSNISRTCGISLLMARKLIEAGYARLGDLRAASDEELLAVEGIGPGTVKKIRKALGGGGE
jgi:DNA integrity scanning protein DisA with diadenylate cyclase activity